MQRLVACQRNSYARTFEAIVLSCEKAPAPKKSKGKKSKKKAVEVDKYRVVLSDTVLFPEGGGQPSDTGRLSNGANVLAVSRDAGLDAVVHLVDKPCEVGSTLSMEVSRNFRLPFEPPC